MDEIKFFIPDSVSDEQNEKPSNNDNFFSPTDTTQIYDLAIIGAGPAGMTAAVYASRKRLKTILITKNIGGQPLLTSKIENYMGFQYISGKTLTDKFYEQMKNFPISLADNTAVIKLTDKNGIFLISTSDGKTHHALSLVIASGKHHKELGVPGEKEFTGKGVAYCATCDAPLFANKDVAVIGGGNSALTSAAELVKIANKLYIINNLPTLQGDEILQEKIFSYKDKVQKFLSHTVTKISGDKSVQSIEISSISDGRKQTIPVSGVFIEIGLVPSSDFIQGDFLRRNQIGEIEVDCRCRTSRPGVFAAGDVTDVPEKQIIIAAGEGAKAALGAYRYLLNKRKG